MVKESKEAKEALKEKLMDIPVNPGVYIMKKNNKIIYIGKAKNLRKRVSSYFNREHDHVKTRELVRNVEDIDFIICNSETDAFILENNLIKKNNPKYNILLKDEKTYPYIRISKEDFPNLKIIRTTKTLDMQSGMYFGPYPSGAWRLAKTLIKLFKIRDCNKDMRKVAKRPCLKYYMNACPAPCVYKDIKEEYNRNIQTVKEVLKGHGKGVIDDLKDQMLECSESMEFEKAIIYREQIGELQNAVNDQVTEYGKDLDEDVFLLAVRGDIVFLCVLNVREGKILGKYSTNFDVSDKIYDNIYELAVQSYYGSHPIPQDITFESDNESDIMETQELLQSYSGKKLEFHFPKIASRRMELLDMGRANIQRDIEAYYKKKSVIEDGMQKIYETLNLKRYPRKIECFDISNIQGTDAVASMSVSVEGRPSKKDYRRFKIRCKDTPDDFMMMREVITRRYSKLPIEQFPDIILIDGGLGQIGSAGQVLADIGRLGISELLSLAKKNEEIYKYGEKEPYVFDKDQEALKIFQRVRDEAHRFGITYHRKLRSKRVISSELDKISGIGEKRKAVLLREFGSVAKITEQTVETLKQYVPEKVAEDIIQLLKK